MLCWSYEQLHCVSHVQTRAIAAVTEASSYAVHDAPSVCARLLQASAAAARNISLLNCAFDERLGLKVPKPDPPACAGVPVAAGRPAPVAALIAY